MKPFLIVLVLAISAVELRAQTPAVVQTDDVAAVTVSPGVVLKELTGRTAAGTARSEKSSVAFFHLDPGCGSAWSFNKVGEESFFVLKGHGEIWTGSRSQPVRAGSFILVPPAVVRSIRAGKDEALEFYAITTPAWSSADDVVTTPPAGAPK